jgi:hypothetical protein
MAITETNLPGNGTAGPFTYTFPALEAGDIYVSVDGVVKTVTTDYSLNFVDKQITFLTTPYPTVSNVIRIYRVTDDADLAATFYSGAAIRATDLNTNFTQGLYVTQESNREAATAISTAGGAVTTANAATATANSAVSTANAATATANTALSNSSAAVSTANTASSNASAAVSTANTASSNATTAVSTANAATATANSAASDAATAISTANSAVSTANTASTTATNAVNTANSASSAASSAVSTANTASSNASAAVSTANTASSNATSAVNTANSALSTANAAASAVANAILYDIVANVAAIPASPANNDAVEVTDSTGIESFTPLISIPGGFAGNSGLSVRIVYTTTGNTWTWIQYFPNDPETRYLKEAVTTSDTAPVSPSDGDLWYDSVGGRTYVYYDDGAGSQWVDTSPQGSGVSDAISEGNTSAEVIDTGSDGRFVVTTEGSERLRVDPSGRLLIGTASARSSGGHTGSFQLEGTTFATATAAVTTNSNDSNGPYLNFGKARGGSIGSTTIVQSGDVLGQIQFNGSDGTSLQNAAFITALVDGTPGANDMPGRLVFSTTSDGTSSPTERLRITSAGRVGIGTSTPGAALQVTSSNAGGYGSIIYNNSPTGEGLVLRAGSTSSHNILVAQTYDGSASRFIVNAAGNVGIGTTSVSETLHLKASAPRIRIEDAEGGYSNIEGDGGSLGIYADNGNTQANSFIRFDIDGTEKSRLTSSGQWLVGTSTARSNIARYGADYTPATQIQTNVTSGWGTGLSLVNYSASGYAPVLTFGLSGSNTAGTNTLVASGDRMGVITFNGNDGTNFEEGARIEAQVDGTPGANDMPGRLVFSTTADGAATPTEKMRISSNGNVGIGSDAPDSRFVIRSHSGVSNTPIFKIEHPSNDADFAISGLYDTDGNITYLGSNLYYNSSYAVARFDTGKPSSGISLSGRTGNGEITFLTGTATATERMRIGVDGLIQAYGLGNSIIAASAQAAGTTFATFICRHSASSTTTGTTSFQVMTNGNAQNTNNSYGAISDIKLKENIVDANSQWDDLKALRVRNYNFKEGQTHTQLGLIAQEVELVSPGLVSESPDRDEDGNDLGTVTKSVNYSVLYMKAVKALQEAMTRIETLEATNASLEARLAALEGGTN